MRVRDGNKNRGWRGDMGVGPRLSSLSALSPPPPPAPVTHSTLSTLCTTAPFPVVLWQCTQLRLPCSPSGDFQSARLLGLLLMFQTLLFALTDFRKRLATPILQWSMAFVGLLAPERFSHSCCDPFWVKQRPHESSGSRPRPPLPRPPSAKLWGTAQGRAERRLWHASASAAYNTG